MMILRVEALLDNGQLKFVPVEVMKETDTIESQAPIRNAFVTTIQSELDSGDSLLPSRPVGANP